MLNDRPLATLRISFCASIEYRVSTLKSQVSHDPKMVSVALQEFTLTFNVSGHNTQLQYERRFQDRLRNSILIVIIIISTNRWRPMCPWCKPRCHPQLSRHTGRWRHRRDTFHWCLDELDDRQTSAGSRRHRQGSTHRPCTSWLLPSDQLRRQHNTGMTRLRLRSPPSRPVTSQNVAQRLQQEWLL